MMREALAKLIDGKDLTTQEASLAMTEIMEGTATYAQVGAFLVAMRLKGETSDEITGMAFVMRQKAQQMTSNTDAVDTCGTGGDGAGTFNISTTAAFVIAGAQQPVAKHGNRAMSSACGSSDVLEMLGANITLGPEPASICLEESGVTFMFAQVFHPAMRFVAPVRCEIGVRTVFNILGPLTNPARVPYQVIGVAVPSLMARMATSLGQLGLRRALVVHGSGGLDELSLAGVNSVYEWTGRDVISYTIHPSDVGLKSAPLSALKGGSAEHNAAILRDVLSGSPGPTRDVVLLNAGAGLYSSGKVNSVKEGVMLAAESIDSGAALSRLTVFISTTQKLGRQNVHCSDNKGSVA